MPSSTGRTTEPRTVASVVTTSGAATFTFPSGAITASDVGRPISGTGIPAGATILSRQSATGATLSANATASGTITATVGTSASTPYGYGFTGWSPETDAEASTQQVTSAGGAGVNDPARLADAVTRTSQRNR